MYTDFMSLEVNIYLGTVNHHLSHKHRGLVNKGWLSVEQIIKHIVQYC